MICILHKKNNFVTKEIKDLANGHLYPHTVISCNKSYSFTQTILKCF